VNGLGATLISIGRLHDALAARGFAVLTFDRAGVGMSDPLPPGARHFGAAETVRDMRALLTHPALGAAAAAAAAGGGARWLLIGPSMGSIVAQAYMASFGDDVAGFLNLDGFPFLFAAKRNRFEWAAVVYRVYEAIIWTGALRPFLAAAGAAGAFSHIVSPPTFGLDVVRGQINEANFFGSLAREFATMLDCADAARAAWGAAYDLQAPERQADALALGRVQPAAYGTTVVDAAAPALATSVDVGAPGADAAWKELPRSAWERGDAWASAEEGRAVLAKLASAAAAAGPSAPLARLFARPDGPVVRVMSARSFQFPGGGDKSFYDAEMKLWIAAEHNLHALLAADGRRVAFPARTHGDLFFGEIECATRLSCEIARALARREGRHAVFAGGGGDKASGDKVSGGSLTIRVAS